MTAARQKLSLPTCLKGDIPLFPPTSAFGRTAQGRFRPLADISVATSERRLLTHCGGSERPLSARRTGSPDRSGPDSQLTFDLSGRREAAVSDLEMTS